MLHDASRSASNGVISARLLRLAAGGLLILALAYLGWRGIWRAAEDSHDLVVGFASARSWAIGHDPYDVATLKSELLMAGGGVLASGDLLDGLRNVYFPTTIPVFLPIAFPVWPGAKMLMLAFNVGAALFIGIGLVRLLDWRWTSARSLTLIAAVLALGPLHLTMSLGQTGILATAGIVAAMLLERSGHGISAGILYGLSAALKVQIGLPFLAYLVWRRRWASTAVAASLLGVVTLLAVGRMHLAGVPWYDSWSRNLVAALGPGGVNDSSPLNVERYSLINLQYPLGSLVANSQLANLITYALVGVAALTMVWLFRDRYPRQDLLALSIVAVLGLLVTYHRYYDAVLLSLPIAWAVWATSTARWREGVAVLCLSGAFLLPIIGVLRTVEAQRLLPIWVTESLVWEALLLPLHTWVLVLTVLVLLRAAARDRHEPSSELVRGS